MDTVCLKPLYHRGQESIAINFKNDASLNLLVRKLPSVKWSQTNKCWYVPLTKASYNLLKEKLQEVSQIDDSVLKTYLEKRKQVTATLPSYDYRSEERRV